MSEKNDDIDDQLMRAVVKENAGVIKNLIARGANPNTKRAIYNPDYEPGPRAVRGALASAAMAGALGNVRALVDAGADVNADDSCALFYAVNGSHRDIVELLQRYGANPNTLYVQSSLFVPWKLEIINLVSGYSLVPVGTEYGMYLDVFRGNLKNNYDVTNVSEASCKNMALALAAACGHLAICKELMARGADPSSSAGSALRYAIKERQVPVVALLAPLTQIKRADYKDFVLETIATKDPDLFTAFWQSFKTSDPDDLALFMRAAEDIGDDALLTRMRKLGFPSRAPEAQIIEVSFGRRNPRRQ
jgi:hypothetical protein